MKKILSIALVLGFSFGLTACEKENAADYYGKLRQECQQKDSKSCCLDSVDKMESAHARQVSHDGECDYGYKKNLLRCPDTFAWCEKEETEDTSKFAYYEKLRENCETKEDKECCLTSAEDMERVGAQEKVTEECPKGTHMNGLLCLSSYQWCEKSQNPEIDPVYYETLLEDCNQQPIGDIRECCINSVKTMEVVGGTVAHSSKDISTACDDGFERNMLNCYGSLAWCETANDTGGNTTPPVPDTAQIICTMEAKQCPDGTFVGRTGPKCEFTECPKKNHKKIKPCTKEYRPICAAIRELCGIGNQTCLDKPNTFPNICEAKNNNAEILYKGKCKINVSKKISLEQLMPLEKSKIPKNCIRWFDGCNICGIENGEYAFCTEIACIELKEPKCLEFKEEVVQACPTNFPDPISLCGINSKVIAIKKDKNGCTIKYGCEENREPKHTKIKK